MTKRNELSLTFSIHGHKKTEAGFGGGQLTSDAGAVPLRESDRHIAVVDAMVACIDDLRDPARVTHDIRTVAPSVSSP